MASRHRGVDMSVAGDRGKVLTCRVLVVDDSRLYREGLVSLLAAELGSPCVAAADSFAVVQGRLEVSDPDVVLVNLACVDDIDVIASIRRQAPGVRVVVVGVDEADEEKVIACAEAGACGYVTRQDSLADLLAVIASVLEGGSHISPRIGSLLLGRVRQTATRRPEPHRMGSLTDREIQILRLISAGCSNQDIADQLTIELHTVKNHVHSVLTKLGARRRGEAAALLASWDRS